MNCFYRPIWNHSKDFGMDRFHMTAITVAVALLFPLKPAYAGEGWVDTSGGNSSVMYTNSTGVVVTAGKGLWVGTDGVGGAAFTVTPSGNVGMAYQAITNGISNTGVISTDILSTTGNALIGGILNMSNGQINSLANGTAAGDAVNFSQLQAISLDVYNAQSTANTAINKVTNAQSTADTADTNAATAQSTANTAQTTANTANTNAGTAQATANTAQTTANTAQTNAATAQSAANTAQTTASTANTNAATAQTTANTAVSNFSSGTVNASLASANLNNGGISNAGQISGVTAATVSDQAVNFAQLQAMMTQLVQSGVCKISGTNVSCGTPTTGAVQVGAGAAVASGATNAIAIGNNAQAQSSGGIAMGNGATAVQSNSVAIGAGATALSSVAVGTGAQAIGTNTTALGDNAVASGQYAVAVGNNAVASHANSVAIGNASTTSSANTVSVGATGSERRITNVAAGIDSTDAVNMSQLNAALNGQGAGTLAAANTYTDQQIKQLRSQAYSGIAQAAAIIPLAPNGAGGTTINVGFASYGGEQAGGVALAHQWGERVNLNAGLGFSGSGTNLVRVGAGFHF
ncbi:MAG: YadA-like family protein [Methylotenera sp.]|nr:YadA-like family protein [Methylotenera sp.]